MTLCHRAEAKTNIAAELGHYYNDKACRKIFLAGTHDTVYAEYIRPLAVDQGAVKKILLTTSWTTRRVHMKLPFEIVEWNDIFSSTLLDARQIQHSPAWKKGIGSYKFVCERGVMKPVPAWNG